MDHFNRSDLGIMNRNVNYDDRVQELMVDVCGYRGRLIDIHLSS